MVGSALQLDDGMVAGRSRQFFPQGKFFRVLACINMLYDVSRGPLFLFLILDEKSKPNKNIRLGAATMDQ